INAEIESEAAKIVRSILPDASITVSHEIGQMGLLERENAAIMNACLRKLANHTVSAFRQSIADMQIDAPLYISQNDGTLMSADFVERYPVLTFASGPTNSMRGAAFLSGLKDAVVVDIGGTTTDLGVLINGFPRGTTVATEIGDVRTNFRMPDVYSFGLGGGSLVSTAPQKIGPESVGYELTTRSLVFGGSTLTTTDVAVAAGMVELGNKSSVENLSPEEVAAVVREIQKMVADGVDRMKTSSDPVPVILVGGGSILVHDELEGASEVIKPDHFAVANAVGAAITQVGGEIDRIFSLANISRDEALEQAREEAISKAIAAGANPESTEIVDIEEIPLAYLPGNATRIRMKAVGDLVL
ncbi:MAG: hydantoinase/oxoprolinase family protein, partial [Chloroflexota bacterium]